MNTIIFNIAFRRGDSFKFKFKRRDMNGNVIMVPPLKLFFTVKKKDTDENYLLQKKLSDFIIDVDGYYHLLIRPEDTNDLPFGEYKYDIEVITDDYVATIKLGNFTLLSEITDAGNEE